MDNRTRTSWPLALAALLTLAACETDEGATPDAGDVGSDMAPDMAEEEGPVQLVLRDLEVQMAGMDPHIGNLMGFRVVSNADELVASGFLDTLPTPVFTWFQPASVPEGTYRLEFWADLNGNRTYDSPPTDHAWVVVLPQTGTATVTFDHNTDFTDIGEAPDTEGGDFDIEFSDMDPHVGNQLELRVIRTADEHVVGQYLLLEIESASFDLSIPGIIEEGADYQVDFYADFNGNTIYDSPPTDHAWRLTGTGTASGLSLNFAHSTNFTDVGF